MELKNKVNNLCNNGLMDGVKSCVITYPSPFTPWDTCPSPAPPPFAPYIPPTTFTPYMPPAPNSIDASKLLASLSNSAYIDKSELTKIAKDIVDYVTTHPEATPILVVASKLLELAK